MPIPLLFNLFPIILAAPTRTHQSREGMAQGFTLLLTLSIIGIVLITGLVLLIVLRRNRHAQQDIDRRLTRPSSRASAWHAAGARAEPINPDPDLPSDDDLIPPNDDPNPNDETDAWDLPDRS